MKHKLSLNASSCRQQAEAFSLHKNYEENYYFCQYSDEEENEFTVGRMEDRNLLNARNEWEVYDSAVNMSGDSQVITVCRQL